MAKMRSCSRIGPTDTFWMVTNARPTSELADVLWETTLQKAAFAFRGTDPADIRSEEATIYCDRNAALRDAMERLAKVGR